MLQLLFFIIIIWLDIIFFRLLSTSSFMFVANHFILFLLDVCNAIIALFIVLYRILISKCLFIFFFQQDFSFSITEN